MEAGGHRGAFHADEAERQMVGLIALLPQIVDAVNVPVIATGGIADARGVTAALILGASAVQIGTGFLRSPEAMVHPVYADQIAKTESQETMITRVFTGRPGRAVATKYTRASVASSAPPPASYPIQRGLTRAMREDARKVGDAEHLAVELGHAGVLGVLLHLRVARADLFFAGVLGDAELVEGVVGGGVDVLAVESQSRRWTPLRSRPTFLPPAKIS